MKESSIDRQYAKELRDREKRLAEDIAKGRTGNIAGINPIGGRFPSIMDRIKRKVPAIGTVVAGLSIVKNAVAGDFEGAKREAKQAIEDQLPDTLGSGELPPEEMVKQRLFNQLRKRLTNNYTREE